MDFSNIPTPVEYNEAAYLARLIANEMLNRLKLVKLQPKRILDLGCGVGADLRALALFFPKAQVYGLDWAHSYLAYGKGQPNFSEQNQNLAWIVADAADLPFPSHSVDFIFANLLLPWCAQPTSLLREWRRVLRPQGLLFFSCLGPDTFKEWQDVNNLSFLPSLVDMHIVGDALVKEGFIDPVLEVEELTLSYSNPKKHQNELQNSGMLRLETDLNGQDLPLTTTFEIIYAHAWCPALKGFKPDQQGTVKIPITELKTNHSSA